MKITLSRHRLARAAFKYLMSAALPLALSSTLSAQTLVHRYSFVTDASDSVGGAAWNGTLVPGSNPATINNGLFMPGTGTSGNPSGYVSLPNGIILGDTNITVECWATQNQPNTWAEIWSFGVSGGSVNLGLIPSSSSGNLRVPFTPNGGEVDINAPGLPSGVEEYLVVTYNVTNTTANLYLNGAIDAGPQNLGTATIAANHSPGVFPTTTDNNFGRDPFGGDAMFNGTLFELRIWTGVVSQRYIGASLIAGPSVLVTNLNPTSITVTAGPAIVITGTEQAAANVTLTQTGTNLLLATGDATNWISSNTNVLTVSTNGLITGVGAGTTTIKATVAGLTATSGNITVTPQALTHRYSFVSDATDSVGGANGTLVPPTTGAAATINNGLILPGNPVNGNGVSGYLSLPNGIVQGVTSLTVETWVTQTQVNTWAEIWDFGINGNTNFCLIPASPTPNMRAGFTPNGGERDITTTVMPTNSQQYVVVTYNNSVLRGFIYTNGLQAATQTFANTFFSPGSYGGANGTTSNMLGNDVFGDPQFSGTIKELRIWNGAVSPLYVEVSAAAGPNVLVTNLNPTLLTLSVTNANLVGAQTEQATIVGNFADASSVSVTGGATNWTSSNTNILTVSTTGLITALSGGTATISATVGGVVATSPLITVQLTVPVITQQPTPVTTVVGEPATFTVAALGGGLNYQWKVGPTAINGATNPVFTLPSVALTDAGLYSVLVSNTLGTSNSVSVQLSVQTSILTHRYSFVSDASDSIGGANGTLVPGSNPATINNGLSLPGTGTSGNPSGYVALPNGLVQGDLSVTVECWATQNQANTWAEIWSFAVNGGSVNFALIPSSPVPNMRVAFTPTGNERDIIAPAALPSGSQQYIAVTYNNANLTGSLYLNGALYSSVVLPGTNYSPGNFPTTTFDTFGSDPFGGDAQFNGTINEVRIWNGVVSPLYLAVSAAAGPGAVPTNLTPTSITITVTNTTLEGLQTEQATATGNFAAVSGVTVTGAVTNWISSNPSVLTVNSNGVITAVGGGSATVSGTVSGITGTSALITVPVDVPTITLEPQATDVLLAGATLHASVSNIGVGPFTYKWFFNNSVTPISGATTSTLIIPNVQSNNSGNYVVTIGNSAGTTNSTPLSLTVVAPTAYEGNLLSLGPLAYWPLNETSGTTAFDLAGGYNGTYNGGITMGAVGPTNAGFGSNSLAATFDGGSGFVDIPEGPFNITNAVAIAAWVQLPSFPGFSDIIGHGDQSWRLTVAPNGDPGANDGGPPADANSPTSIADGNWHFLVYSYDGTLTGVNGSLYVDGSLVASNSIATVPAGNNLDVWIGGAPDYGTAFGTARLFAGSIAHAAVFNHALSAAQVHGLFVGQSMVNIRTSGKNVVITWPSGVLLQASSLNGPWTTNSAAVSPYTNSAATGTQFFKVQISH